ncbi:MAG: class I SAM-dependent methyltransferase [Chitinophagaceae bacterium]
MESLRQIFEKHNGRLLHKWEHYIEVYDAYLHKYRNTELVFLEIGVAHGGSLEMWRKYFGEKATIIGVDVNPECKKFEDGNTKVIIGSQEDENFLEGLKNEVPAVHVLLDDGGHTMKQQTMTFNSLFELVKEDGLYICEDIHTSYWKNYGGGFKKKHSFIEFSKNLIDYLHGWHAVGSDKNKIFNHLTESIYGLHYYDSILVIEKRRIVAPQHSFKGSEQLEKHFVSFGQRRTIIKKLKDFVKSL